MQSIVTVRDVSLELPGGRLLFSDLNFSLEPGVTALVGPNGVGKTCLAQILAGTLEPSHGSIRRNGVVSYFRQRQDPPLISVAEFLSPYNWSILGESLLNEIDRDLICSHLSGGQWMRARLARALTDGYLILDEPTNDLDREGRQALLHFLREYKDGILLISHDRECLELCHNVLELSNLELSKFTGNWSDYEEAKTRERRNRQRALETAKRDRETMHRKRVEQLARQDEYTGALLVVSHDEVFLKNCGITDEFTVK